MSPNTKIWGFFNEILSFEIVFENEKYKNLAKSQLSQINCVDLV